MACRLAGLQELRPPAFRSDTSLQVRTLFMQQVTVNLIIVSHAAGNDAFTTNGRTNGQARVSLQITVPIRFLPGGQDKFAPGPGVVLTTFFMIPGQAILSISLAESVLFIRPG